MRVIANIKNPAASATAGVRNLLDDGFDLGLIEIRYCDMCALVSEQVCSRATHAARRVGNQCDFASDTAAEFT